MRALKTVAKSTLIATLAILGIAMMITSILLYNKIDFTAPSSEVHLIAFTCIGVFMTGSCLTTNMLTKLDKSLDSDDKTILFAIVSVIGLFLGVVVQTIPNCLTF
jgi:hypothetical protein